MKPCTTKMSSKGQVVIPEEVRQQLGLVPGTQFVVVGKGDVVVLKTISPPEKDEFEQLVTEARRQARTAKLKPSDIKKTVREVKRRK